MSLSKVQRIEARQRADARKAALASNRLISSRKEAEQAKVVREKLSRREVRRPSGIVSREVFRLSPRLLDSPEYALALDYMNLSASFIRPPSDWEPRGKGRETLFRSLAEHLYSKYPMPPFLWSVFFEPEAHVRRVLIHLVTSLAAGNSFIEEVKTGGFPVPLTRKMCHEVLRSPADMRFLEAVRRVQVRTAGGDDRLWKAWIRTRPGQLLGSEADETFWASVIHWLAQNPMLDRAQVGPMTDYIQFRRREDPSFSMKGRSANALFDAMMAWHGELQRAKASAGQVFAPSGFQGAEFDHTRESAKGGLLIEIWRIREILTGKDLAREGSANKHCVYSYARSIETGGTSIWSMTREDNSGNWHALTIEVRNPTKSIVQARGIFNRPSTGPEGNVLVRWADMNRLTVSTRL